MIYLTMAVLLLGQLILGIGLLRLTGKVREVGTTAMNAFARHSGEPDDHGDGAVDGIPAALRPGSTVPPQGDGEQGWRVWVVLSSAHAALAAELRPPSREIADAFRLQVLFVDYIPAGLKAGPGLEVLPATVETEATQLPAICMIDPDGTVQGAGRISTADEVIGFINEGAHHGLGPTREVARP